jgi:hypothetical protein
LHCGFEGCPFVGLPVVKSSRWGGGVTADEMREMQWVKPELVAQIRFVEWTAEGRLRHAAFLGLRSDKSARMFTDHCALSRTSSCATVGMLYVLRRLDSTHGAGHEHNHQLT